MSSLDKLNEQKTINLDASEEKLFWELINAPFAQSKKSKKLGKIMRGEL